MYSAGAGRFRDLLSLDVTGAGLAGLPDAREVRTLTGLPDAYGQRSGRCTWFVAARLHVRSTTGRAGPSGQDVEC